MPTPNFASYLNIRTAYAPSFAPDGASLSFLTDISGVAEVWRVGLDFAGGQPGWPEQISFRGERVQDAVFAPDRDALLVTADLGGNERSQFALVGGDGTGWRELTHQLEVIHAGAHWSPDGLRLLYTSNARDPRFFDLYEMTVADGNTRRILTHDDMLEAAAYAPDGRSALILRYADWMYRNQLALVDLATGTVRMLTPDLVSGRARYAWPAWMPDGQQIYLTCDRDHDVRGLARLDVATGELTWLREERWDAEELAVSRDGRRLALTFNEDGASRLELWDISQGWEGRAALPLPVLPSGVYQYLTWSRDGERLALTVLPAADTTDVWAFDLPTGQTLRVTHSATGGVARASFVAPELVEYPTFDGRQIPAYFFRPPGAQPTNLPVVIWVHGGPEGQTRPNLNAVIQYFVAHGYAVLAPNVRGSTGYGMAYMSLDDVEQRMDSVADLRHAALWLAQSGIADPRRIAVMGGSYGGFMVLAAVTTYPDLWAAGIDIVGIANFITFLEQTGPWRRKLREAEYGSLERDHEFLRTISPIHNADRITVPLFVIHGQNDPRVPVGEAEQIVGSLRGRGVPVEYLNFADEGHGLVKRANRLVAYPAIAAFLGRALEKPSP